MNLLDGLKSIGVYGQALAGITRRIDYMKLNMIYKTLNMIYTNKYDLYDK